MKLSAALTTLATLSVAAALPNGFSYEKRQFSNGTLTNGTSTSAGGGAGVGAQGTGLTTQTVVQTVTSIVSQQYTTYPVTNVFTETIVIPGAGAGVAPVATNVPGVGSSGTSSSGSGPVVVVAGSGTSGTSSGSISGSGSGSGVDAGSACVCSVPVVVATGIYTVTVQNVVNLGTTTYTTAYPTTTLGVITISGGAVMPAVATVTNSAVVAQNTNAPLAPGQSYQTITIPGTTQTIVVVVTVVTDVVAPVSGNGNGVGAQANSAPFSNSTMSSTLPVGAGVGAQQNALSTTSSTPSATAIAGTPVTPTAEPVTSVPAATTAPAAATGQPVGTNATPVGDLGTTPLYNQQAFIDDMLDYHNTLRARNSAPAMTWNADLAQVALNNVNANAAAGTFEHTYQMGISNPYGENIAEQYGYNNPQYLVWVWYEENQSYSFSDPGYSDATGHFTQLVWVDSTELGCAYTQADDANGTYYLACEYSPAGNYAGEFEANVLPATTDDQPAQPATNI